MEMKIYGQQDCFIVSVDCGPPFSFGELIENLPTKIVEYKSEIDMKKTLHFFNEQFNQRAFSVMLVDDDHDFLKVTKSELLKLGHYVEVYSCAETAYSLFKKDPTRFDKIIIDQNMPSISGDSFTNLIYTHNVNVKMCILTSSVESVPNSFSGSFSGGIQIFKKPCKMINIVGSAFKPDIDKDAA